jgi:hypothetical protein
VIQGDPEITVSIEGVQKLLQKLNPQKACGPDQIPARIRRDLADVIAPPLTLIFQKSLDEGNIPNDIRHLVLVYQMFFHL